MHNFCTVVRCSASRRSGRVAVRSGEKAPVEAIKHVFRLDTVSNNAYASQMRELCLAHILVVALA